MFNLVVLDHPDEIHEGYAPLVECHSSHVTCKFTELLAKYDKRTGEVVESAPNINALQKGDWALVRLEPSKPMVVEPFTEFAPLGRIVVRDLQRTVAVGVIKSVSKNSTIR